MEDAIFDNHHSKKSNKSEFTNLFFHRITTIVRRGLFTSYKRKTCGNWKLRVSLDNRLLITEEGWKSDIDVVKRVDLFDDSKTDYESNNNE